MDLDTNGGGFALKSQLGLNGLSLGEANLVDHSEFPAGGFTKDGSTTVLLTRDVVAPSGELATKERQLILVGEDKVPGVQLVHGQDSARILDLSRSSLGCALLLPKLTGGTFGRKDSGRSHFDSKWSKKTARTQPLGVLPAKMAPFGVPKEQLLLQQSEVGCGLLGETFKSKGLGSVHYIVEGTNDRKGGLMMVGNGDTIAAGQLEVGGVPFKNKTTPLILGKKDLRTEESNLQAGKKETIALKD